MPTHCVLCGCDIEQSELATCPQCREKLDAELAMRRPAQPDACKCGNDPCDCLPSLDGAGVEVECPAGDSCTNTGKGYCMHWNPHALGDGCALDCSYRDPDETCAAVPTPQPAAARQGGAGKSDAAADLVCDHAGSCCNVVCPHGTPHAHDKARALKSCAVPWTCHQTHQTVLCKPPAPDNDAMAGKIVEALRGYLYNVEIMPAVREVISATLAGKDGGE